jgi:hypothetical protein
MIKRLSPAFAVAVLIVPIAPAAAQQLPPPSAFEAPDRNAPRRFPADSPSPVFSQWADFLWGSVSLWGDSNLWAGWREWGLFRLWATQCVSQRAAFRPTLWAILTGSFLMGSFPGNPMGRLPIGKRLLMGRFQPMGGLARMGCPSDRFAAPGSGTTARQAHGH